MPGLKYAEMKGTMIVLTVVLAVVLTATSKI